MKDRDILIWLNSINQIGTRSIEKLNQYFGSLKNIWDASNSEINSCGILSNIAMKNLTMSKNDNYINKIFSKIEKEHVKTITIVDKEYPEQLKNIYLPPKVLYIKGDMIKEDEICLAMVGARKATYYGKWVAEKISKGLSRYGITIISGLARGIDTVSHRGALESQGRTFGVLGCGVDIIYPKSNKKLYDQIINNGGIISEYPLGTEPVPGNFPQRNRIISGLARGVIVVEAKKKSGSLITANFALDQGKDVFAVPGNINSLYSEGTNELIKDGAKLISDAKDVIGEMIHFKDVIKDTVVKNDYLLSEEEKRVVDTLKYGPLHCDMISYNTNINMTNLISILTILEIKGIIKQMSGKIFIINN
ncbi:DNA-processing protein DprA [Clostridiaceae bacterium M8S5]|nr:DNA-processing protein DprA [Clostridiaceae bacterium M8S5]